MPTVVGHALMVMTIFATWILNTQYERSIKHSQINLRMNSSLKPSFGSARAISLPVWLQGIGPRNWNSGIRTRIPLFGCVRIWASESKTNSELGYPPTRNVAHQFRAPTLRIARNSPSAPPRNASYVGYRRKQSSRADDSLVP